MNSKVREILKGAELYRKFVQGTPNGNRYPKAWDKWISWQRQHGVEMSTAARCVYNAALAT